MKLQSIQEFKKKDQFGQDKAALASLAIATPMSVEHDPKCDDDDSANAITVVEDVTPDYHKKQEAYHLGLAEKFKESDPKRSKQHDAIAKGHHEQFIEKSNKPVSEEFHGPIGKTKSGRSVYAHMNPNQYDNESFSPKFTSNDHKDAAELHRQKAAQYHNERMKDNKSETGRERLSASHDYHVNKAEQHEKMVKESFQVQSINEFRLNERRSKNEINQDIAKADKTALAAYVTKRTGTPFNSYHFTHLNYEHLEPKIQTAVRDFLNKEKAKTIPNNKTNDKRLFLLMD